MTNLPKQYAWLDQVKDAPKVITEALKLYGVHEGLGDADNPVILGWAKEVGLEKTYTHDSIAWCGLFAALVVTRAGHTPVEGPLWALNWQKYGTHVESVNAALGDVLVFVRKGGGHVGFYVGEDATAYHVLGGNTADSVSIARIAKYRCAAVRRTAWAKAQPAGVVKHVLDPTGALSTNEA